MQRLLDAVRRSAAAFGRDRRGNVAVIFSLATLPLVAFVGAAIDFSHASSIKTAFQNALDSTALMLSKEASNETSSVLQANATKYFNALFSEPNVSSIAITASYATDGGSKVTVDGTANVATSFLRVMNILYPSKFNNIAIGGTSTAAWGSNRLRVALVLDNTGSMGEAGKMSALKTATQSLLTQLTSAASANGDVYVSVVPFVKDVNVGSGNYNSDWIYWGNSSQDPGLQDDTSWDANNGSCSKSYSSSGYASPRAACLAKNNAKWTAASHSTWNGCVMDRGFPKSPSTMTGKSGPDTTDNYDTNVGALDTTKISSLYAAEQYSFYGFNACPQAAMGLSYDWTAMQSLVNNMSPNGTTNQAIGLQLGWLSLIGGGPFTAPAKDPNYQYSEIIILLTDGLNTEDRWYGNGFSSSTDIDARQATTCSNVKAAGITLYTIQVNTDGDPTSSVLQNCASTSDKFFMLTSASQILTTFQAIGTNLTQLRIAK